MITLLIVEILAVIILTIAVCYFILSSKITIKLTDKLIKKTGKDIESFILIPSLIILITGLLYIVGIVLIIVFNIKKLSSDNTFIIYILVGALIGLFIGLINSLKTSKAIKNKYGQEISFSSNSGLIGSNVIFYSSSLSFISLAIYVLISYFSK